MDDVCSRLTLSRFPSLSFFAWNPPTYIDFPLPPLILRWCGGTKQSEIRKYRDVYRLYDFPRRQKIENESMAPRKKDTVGRTVSK